MAATASNTELPGTAVITMRSLGPDWRHDKLVLVLWRTWFAASTQPIPLRMGPQSLKVHPTLLLGSTLLFARCSSCVGPLFDNCHGRTLVLLLERCNRWQNGATLYYRHWESRCCRTHITTLYSASKKPNTHNWQLNPQTAHHRTTNICDPNGGLNSVI
jgi:hypothetical protein